MPRKTMTKQQRTTVQVAIKNAMDICGCHTYEDFARAINVCEAAPGVWRRGEGGVSITTAKRIEKVTKGKVTIFDLVPDLQKYK